MAATLKPVYLIYGDEFQVDQALRRLKQRIAAEAAGTSQTAEGGGALAGTDAPSGTDADARLDVKEFDVGAKGGQGATAKANAGATGRNAAAGAQGRNVAAEAVQAAGTLPFFAVTNLVVVRNVDKLKADDQRILADYAANPSPATVLVMTAAKMAKSAVLFKAVDRAGQTFEYTTPKGPELVKWVTQEFKDLGKTIDAATARALVGTVGSDQATLLTETQKISAYAGAESEITGEAIEAVATRNPETSIFTMVDALGHKRTAEALSELTKLLNAGEPAQRILYMIVRQYRILLKTKALENTKAPAGAAAKAMGVAPFLVDKYKAQARRYGEDELRRVYTLLKDTDVAMKTGRQEPNLALEMLVGKITS